jgi:hypothetical protein
LRDFAGTCVFAKQSLEPILCDPLRLRGASPLRLPRVPLIPKLRGNFAEFLLHRSLAHLRLLASPTCVRLRYGHKWNSPPRLFSAACLNSLQNSEELRRHPLSATQVFYPPGPPTTLHPDNQRRAKPTLLRPPCGSNAPFVVRDYSPDSHRLRPSASA